METRAVVSSSAWRDYSFSLPIACLLWREVVGYEPLVLLVEDEAFWMSQPKRASVSLDSLREFKFDVRFIGHMDDKYEHATIAQSARQHSACYDIPGDTWLLLSDADLWPLKRDFYHQHGEKPIALYYANGDHYQSFPTCHQTMQVNTWREVMQLNPDLGINGALCLNFTGLPTDGFRKWMWDQAFSSSQIIKSRWWEAGVQKIERRGHPPVDRLDRSCWPETYDMANYTDAHIFKAPDQPENWPRLLDALKRVLPSRAAWADDYRTRFLAGY